MCSLNLNTYLEILFHIFEVVFATPVVNHMERSELQSYRGVCKGNKMRKREPLAVTARMCSSRVSHKTTAGFGRTVYGKTKRMGGVSVERETSSTIRPL